MLRALMPPTLALLLVALLAGCGSADKSFKQQGLKFSYPSDFRAGSAVGAHPPGQIVGIVGLDQDDYIAVRGIRGAAPLDQLKVKLPSVVLGVIPASVRSETHGKLKMVSAVQQSAAGSASQIYFFNGSGHTWELECRSLAPKRATMRAACRKAVGSVGF